MKFIVEMLTPEDVNPRIVKELVCCKDCQKSHDPCNGWDRRCELIGVVPDDFYCGWGVPKEQKGE